MRSRTSTTSRVLLALALAMATFAAAPSATTSAQAAPTTGTFRALSYNVAGLPALLSGSSPEINMPYISPLLNGYDLVLVQEDWANPDPPLPDVEVYHEILISEVDHPYLSEPAPVPLGTNPVRPSALVSDGLNRMSRFPFGELTRVMWPNCFGGIDTSDGGAGDCLSEKGFSVARTEFAPGVEIDVYNLHAEAGNTPVDIGFRAEDFEILAAYINDHSADRAVIVGGDYNLHTDRPHDAAIYDTFLADAGMTSVCDVLDCGADTHAIDRFTYKSGGGVTVEPLTHNFERDVFVRPTDGARLSDHDAVRVDFRWTVDAPAATSIAGAVTDPSGQPLAEVTVQAYGPNDVWLPSRQTTTAADGSYDLADLTPDVYRLRFVPPSGSNLVVSWFDGVGNRNTSTPVDATTAPVTAADLQFQTAVTVTGTVTGPDGAPAAGVTVGAYSPVDTWVASSTAITDADGNYSITGIEATQYRVFFQAPTGSGLPQAWYDQAPNRSQAAIVDLTAGGTAVDVDHTYAEPAAT